MAHLNETHDPTLRSWVESANLPGTDFPIQNLPFAVFRRAEPTPGRGGTRQEGQVSTDRHEPSAERFPPDFRGGVAIGDQIVDLRALSELRVATGTVVEVLAAAAEPTLNRLMAMGPAAWSELRKWLSEALRAGSPHSTQLRSVLVPQALAEYGLPATIGDYTDFYASIHHASSVGRLFRPDNPLLPNYKWVPIAYHGRTSTIAISGQTFHRPHGQLLPPGNSQPSVGPSRRLDYELEVGMLIGPGNRAGHPIGIDVAERHLFGLCLLNDWSARDIQAWEYQPLGPFLAKNFATTISPWIVTLEALAPYRVPWTRAQEDPQPLPYLDSEAVRARGAFDIQLEAYLETERMRALGLAPQALSRTSFRHSYWTVAQMLAHHTINGCEIRPGDLFGSGTQSGPTAQEAGSLLELTAGGKQPITLASGEARTFLEDGDRVIFKAACQEPGHARIGFGAVSGTILPALPDLQ